MAISLRDDLERLHSKAPTSEAEAVQHASEVATIWARAKALVYDRISRTTTSLDDTGGPNKRSRMGESGGARVLMAESDQATLQDRVNSGETDATAASHPYVSRRTVNNSLTVWLLEVHWLVVDRRTRSQHVQLRFVRVVGHHPQPSFAELIDRLGMSLGVFVAP